MEHFDVLIVGAGISGISAAYYLQKSAPERTYAVLEARNDIGGTWDLFRYPGLRSDTEMFTYGFSFRPWKHDKSIGDRAAILEYLRDTADALSITQRIRFRHRVSAASWSSADARWTVEVGLDDGGASVFLTCSFLFMGTGYFEYSKGYTPEFPGMEQFGGRIVHPQEWPDDIEYAAKRVVVIGSGATAVTLVPRLAEHAEHVVMLQRSPTYIIVRPSVDRFARRLRKLLPEGAAHRLLRTRNLLIETWFYYFCTRRPERAKKWFRKHNLAHLGPDYDLETHFTPRYKPLEQRVCLDADGRLFEAIRTGRVSVVTDVIESFTETGLKLGSGAELKADLVVTATGFNMQLMQGLHLEVDGRRVDLAQALVYRGLMFSDVPNLAASGLSLGYFSAPWTAKAELGARFVCRLLKHMQKTGTKQCTPRLRDPGVESDSRPATSSGYLLRAESRFPAHGSKKPWRPDADYFRNMWTLRFGGLEDGTMEFSTPPVAVEVAV